MVIRCTNDLAESSLTDWSARISTFRIVSKCHLLLCEYFSTIRQTYVHIMKMLPLRDKFGDKLLVSGSDSNTFSSSLMMELTFSG
jgi:hypothetical protein